MRVHVLCLLRGGKGGPQRSTRCKFRQNTSDTSVGENVNVWSSAARDYPRLIPQKHFALCNDPETSGDTPASSPKSFGRRVVVNRQGIMTTRV